MRIQLVTPKNPPSFWTFDSVLDLLDVDCIFPNLSMPTVAGLTPPGHELVLSDENLGPVPLDLEVDLVGITGYPIHRDRIVALAAAFRARGRLVVLGGPYATLFPEEASEIADVVFVGEAEETWPVFLAELAAGVRRSRYVAERRPDLSNVPMPRFDLVEVDRYHAMAIQFSRGCPFRCEFCDITTMYGRTPRTKSVASMLAEIEACHAAGARQVFIVDDNFAGNKRLAKQLLVAMADWSREHHYPLEFNTELSLDVTEDPELLDLLREANFTTVFVGIESPNLAALAETGKTQNTRSDLVESVRRFHEHGIQVQAGMIVGFDADGTDIFDQQAAFAQQAHIPIVMVGMLQAIEGTRLYDRVLAEGRLIHTRTGDQFTQSNIVPANMTPEQLHAGYRRLLATLYDWKAYEDRTVGFLLQRGPHASSASLFSRRDLRALPGVLGLFFGRHGLRRARFSWRVLGRVARRRPSAMVEALSFIVMHKAMYDYTQSILDGLVAPVLSEGPRLAGVPIELAPTRPRPLQAVGGG
jgi:radical SAM superfamily enzyme YgiQ (UPF0313 family)